MEHFFSCPYCWEKISMILEKEEESPEYIEDCEVCCRPIELHVSFRGMQLLSFSAQQMEGI